MQNQTGVDRAAPAAVRRSVVRRALVEDVAVAVVNYNTCELLVSSVESILAEAPAELIVVDNASPDGSAEMVRTRFPGVRLIGNEYNGGYAAALNQAFRATKSPYVLVLNADARVLPGSLERARDYMAEHPRAGLTGPLLQTPEGVTISSYFPFPGTFEWLLENDPVAPVIAVAPAVRRRLLRYTPPVRPMIVPWVLGAAMLIRRDAFDEVGGFDESYFMYFEEVDFCFRIRAAGWEVHFSPSAAVVHVGAASTSQQRSAMAVHHYRSTIRFYRNHYSGAPLRFWLLLMRSKMLMRLARDGFLTRFAVHPDERLRAAERSAAWRTALFDGRS